MDQDSRRVPRLVGLSIAALLLLATLWAGYRGLLEWQLDRPLAGSAASFEIEKGDSLPRILRRLQERGIIEHAFWLQRAAQGGALGRHIRYGEYEISPGMTARDLLEMFVAGRVRQHAITIVEGWSFRDLIASLNRHPDLAPDAMGRSPEEIMALLGAAGQSPEGRFFPDTYFVSRGTSDLEVLRRAFAKMESVLAAEWASRSPGLPYATPYEALTLASIVEKETALAEERPQVAGVFIRRLQKKMRLQTDPTVIYGMGEAFQGNLRKDDLRRDTPYNTYTRSGLPPTPIALPGLAAIRAALHPDSGDSLYFVGRGDGSHVFSADLETHNQAVKQYQRR